MNKSSVQAITRAVEAQIIAAGGTKAGADWAIQTLDPFHDTELPDCNGAPSGSGLPVVHQCIRQQLTLRKPSTITTAGWDCHIVNFPFLDPTWFNLGSLLEAPYNNTSGINDYITPIWIGDTSAKINVGGCTAISGPVGFNATQPYVSPNTLGIAWNNISPPNVFTKGQFRVSAQAFEVRSVGPELYRSGTANMWQLPVPDVANAVTSSVANYTGPANQANQVMNTILMDSWPGTESEAMVIPSTTTGAAIDGCYVVSRMNTLYPRIFDAAGHNFIIRAYDQTAYNNIVYNSGDPNGTINVVPAYGPSLFKPNITVGGGSASAGFTTASSFTLGEFDMCGAQFLGLSDTDVLTITCKWYITRYPSEDQLEILVSQKPAPVYDPVAFLWYSKHASLLPSGVRVRDNALGDWFRSVVGTVGGAIRSIAPAAAGVLSMAGPKGKAASALLTALTSEKKKVKAANNKVDNLSREVKRMKVSPTNPMTKKVGKILKRSKRNK